MEESRIRLFVTPWTVLSRPLCPWNSPGQNTGVGSRSLLQGIFPNQGSNRSSALQADSLSSEPPGKTNSIKIGQSSEKCECYKNKNLTLELSSATYQLWKFSLFLRSSVFLLIGPTWGLIEKMARYVDLTNKE